MDSKGINKILPLGINKTGFFNISLIFFLLYKSILINILGFGEWTQAMFSTWVGGGGEGFISSFADDSHFLQWLPRLKNVVTTVSLVKIHKNGDVQAKREVTFLEHLSI